MLQMSKRMSINNWCF